MLIQAAGKKYLISRGKMLAFLFIKVMKININLLQFFVAVFFCDLSLFFVAEKNAGK